MTANEKYKDVKGTVAIGSFDFCYDAHDLIVRGNFDYGHLTDSELITKYNMSMRNDSPTPKQAIGSAAISAGVEAGYNLFGIGDNAKLNGQSLYLFGRYEYYDSMYKTEGTIQDAAWCGRQRVAVGLNYRPISDIVIKAEYSIGLLDKMFNNEPSFSIGIAYSGLFKR